MADNFWEFFKLVSDVELVHLLGMMPVTVAFSARSCSMAGLRGGELREEAR